MIFESPRRDEVKERLKNPMEWELSPAGKRRMAAEESARERRVLRWFVEMGSAVAGEGEGEGEEDRMSAAREEEREEGRKEEEEERKERREERREEGGRGGGIWREGRRARVWGPPDAGWKWRGPKEAEVEGDRRDGEAKTEEIGNRDRH